MTFSIALLAIIGVATGLEVGPVRLVNDNRYITYERGPAPNNSVLECPCELSWDEELQKISWAFWSGEEKVGTYEWVFTPPEGIATGILQGMVNLSRDDGYLELTEVKYKLGGFYSCAATLHNGYYKEAAKWEAVVIDMTSGVFYVANSVDYETCTYNSSYSAPAVYPPPTVHCGMYSEERGGFYDEVSALEWKKVVYMNKSTAYSHKDRVFKINGNTARDNRFLCTLGVTKTDGTLIRLSESESLNNIWKREPGCDVPSLNQNQTYSVTTTRKNCLEQLLPESSGIPITMTVSCKEGYHPPEEGVSQVVMVCDTAAMIWTTGDGHVPNLNSLHCINGAAGVASSAALVMAIALLLSLVQQ